VFLLSHDAKLAQILHTNYIEDILIFPPKWCHVRFSLDLPLFVLGQKGHRSNFWLSSNPIGLLYFLGPWTLDPHVKVTFKKRIISINLQFIFADVAFFSGSKQGGYIMPGASSCMVLLIHLIIIQIGRLP
jgi:hypothetical protein